MTNQEAFEKAMEYLYQNEWLPEYAFNMPMRVMWIIVRINQAFNHSNCLFIPENYKQLQNYEKRKMK